MNDSTNVTITDRTKVDIGPITTDDATWILTSSFIIFTMQSGFGLLEAGAVTCKNEVNIMVKNAADVIFGGLTYWMFGFGLSFGVDSGSNAFCGVGYFFVDSDDQNMGILFSTFVFQLSFATTATTIVSGAMAERTRLSSYIVFSFLNTVVYCIPAHWLWSKQGFLYNMGVVDIAGSGGVHLVGGVSAFVAAIVLKPRLNRYDNGTDPLPMGNPVNSLLGTFMLWWGWLGFNCGSTFGISGGKWKLAAKAAIVTLNGSIGGGTTGIIVSYVTRKRKYDVGIIVSSILGGLVSITASCAVIRPWEALIVGTLGGCLSIVATKLVDKLKVDDPVAATAVHGFCGCWGMLATGIFCTKDTLENVSHGRSGLLHGGGFYLLGVQTLACVCIVAWSSVVTLILILPIHMSIGIRLDPHEERIGADYVEHNIQHNHDSNIIFSSRSTSCVGIRSESLLELREVTCENPNIPSGTNKQDQQETIQQVTNDPHIQESTKQQETIQQVTNDSHIQGSTKQQETIQQVTNDPHIQESTKQQETIQQVTNDSHIQESTKQQETIQQVTNDPHIQGSTKQLEEKNNVDQGNCS